MKLILNYFVHVYLWMSAFAVLTQPPGLEPDNNIVNFGNCNPYTDHNFEQY